jgi:hypothetical protein
MGINIYRAEMLLEPDRESEGGSHPSIRDQAIKREKKLHKIGETMGYPIELLQRGAYTKAHGSV